MNTKIKQLAIMALVTVTAFGCRKENGVIPEEQTKLTDGQVTDVYGVYVLNEGNWGSNKASLDYYDYSTGTYRKNIYGNANPEVTLGLGDVGNDIKIYGSRLYVVVNSSNKVEVLDVKTAKKIGKVDVTNCRYITFNGGKAYVTSYEGYVAVIDTATIAVTKNIPVGREPEEMAIVNNKLYVANSGGYSPQNYESTVSVIDLATETETKKIEVAINLNRLKADQYGDIYVSSRGDYDAISSNLYVIDTKTDEVKKSFNIATSNFTIHNDVAYVMGISYDSNWNTVASYAKINVKDETVMAGSFITDGTEKNIKVPYGIAVDPLSEDIYVTDAKDYTTPGELYCFDKTGKKKFQVSTGDIPAHLVFYTKNHKSK
jgi:YVTN family beta-propeller protein